MFLRFSTVMFVLVISAAAFGKDVNIGAVKLKITPPSGFCELDENRAADKRMLVYIRGMAAGNTLLAALANCKELTDWRAPKGPLIQHMLQYQTVASLIDASFTPDELKGACDEMRASGEKETNDLFSDAKARSKKLAEKLEFNTNQFLGILDEKPGEVCYGATLQKIKAETGAEIVQSNIFATTIVRGRVVYIYFASPYVDSSSLSTALANLKIYYADLAAANK
jgi:hypothetical protein